MHFDNIEFSNILLFLFICWIIFWGNSGGIILGNFTFGMVVIREYSEPRDKSVLMFDPIDSSDISP